MRRRTDGPATEEVAVDSWFSGWGSGRLELGDRLRLALTMGLCDAAVASGPSDRPVAPLATEQPVRASGPDEHVRPGAAEGN